MLNICIFSNTFVFSGPVRSLYCRGFTSNSLAERRGTRYLSLHVFL